MKMKYETNIQTNKTVQKLLYINQNHIQKTNFISSGKNSNNKVPDSDEIAKFYTAKTTGLVRELNPGPLAPKARIMPLDQRAAVVWYTWNVNYKEYIFVRSAKNAPACKFAP